MNRRWMAWPLIAALLISLPSVYAWASEADANTVEEEWDASEPDGLRSAESGGAGADGMSSEAASGEPAPVERSEYSEDETAEQQPEDGMESEDEPALKEEPALEGGSEADLRLTISILGDSISAYADWSSGAAADTSNSTIRDSAVYYTAEDMPVESLWWYRAAEELDARILVNNSWSGSCVYGVSEYAGPGTEGYGERCVNLHDDTGENAGEEPDIIAVFMGSNDLTFSCMTLGNASSVAYDALIHVTDSGVTYTSPKSTAEAFAIMLDKITRRYPNAEIYCFTCLARRESVPAWTALLEGLNDTIRTVAAHYGAYLVDIYTQSGITREGDVFDAYMMDRLHPNEAGMEAIAEVFVSAVRQHTPAMPVAPPAVPGDANGDGTADGFDAVRILQYTVGLTEAPDKDAADMDRDGEIGPADAALILSQ